MYSNDLHRMVDDICVSDNKENGVDEDDEASCEHSSFEDSIYDDVDCFVFEAKSVRHE